MMKNFLLIFCLLALIGIDKSMAYIPAGSVFVCKNNVGETARVVRVEMLEDRVFRMQVNIDDSDTKMSDWYFGKYNYSVSEDQYTLDDERYILTVMPAYGFLDREIAYFYDSIESKLQEISCTVPSMP